MIEASRSKTASTSSHFAAKSELDLSVQLGRLALKNPVLVASGTFGYAKEMAGVVSLPELGGVLPKTITQNARPGNAPWRTVETSSGLLNAIGLDNDGIDYFLANHWPYLKSTGATIVVSIAGKSLEDFVLLAKRLNEAEGLEAVELNVSCPNVSGGVDFGTDAQLCFEVVSNVRKVLNCAIVTKLTPNVTRIVDIARAAKDAGTDAVTCINTVLGMAIDWRKRKPMLANVVGGLSGPAIKPIALRCVYQVASQVGVPVIGVGGIATVDDMMEFLVAGASAIQIGTANYYDPLVSIKLIRGLPEALASIGATSVREIIGTLRT